LPVSEAVDRARSADTRRSLDRRSSFAPWYRPEALPPMCRWAARHICRYAFAVSARKPHI